MKNIEFILVTASVLKEDKSIDSRTLHIENKLLISVTNDVSKLEKSIVFNEDHPLNKEFISVKNDVLKLEKSIDTISFIFQSIAPLNISFKLVTFSEK